MTELDLDYENCKCFFCGGDLAGYQRAEDKNPSGPFFDACEACARRPYPSKEAV